MNFSRVPWHVIVLGAIKLLKTFGLIPGAVAAFSIRKLLQKRKQDRAIAGWPTTEGRIWSGKVHTEGRKRHWVELTYSYYVEEYRSGTHVHRFGKKEDAYEFVRRLHNMRVQVRYNASKPDESVILERDLEMLALLAPQSS